MFVSVPVLVSGQLSELWRNGDWHAVLSWRKTILSRNCKRNHIFSFVEESNIYIYIQKRQSGFKKDAAFTQLFCSHKMKYMTLNGSHNCHRIVNFKSQSWSSAVWLVQVNCKPEPGINLPDAKKPVANYVPRMNSVSL